jgi:hypothetical protein
MTTEIFITDTASDATAMLNQDNVVLFQGTRICREGMDWCVTHPGGAFETIRLQHVCADRGMSATELIEWVEEFAS